MKKRVLGLALSAICLFSIGACASSGSSSAWGHVYTVTFYDDASEPQVLGWAYVIEGKGVTGPTKLASEDVDYTVSKAPIDWLTMPKGGYRSFDKWVGAYADSTAVDLSSITADCSLHATFETKIYDWSIYFINNGVSLIDPQMVGFGSSFALPDATPTEAFVDYHTDSAFLGYGLQADDSDPKPTVDPSSVGYLWGEGAPSSAEASANKGNVYLDRDPTDAKGRQTYPAYVSDGAKWISLGELRSGSVKLSFVALYAHADKDFPVTVYGSKSDYDSGADPLASFDITYGTPLTIASAGTSTTFAYCSKAEPSGTVVVATSAAVNEWKGVYHDTGEDRYDGHFAETNAIVGPVSFYPVFA